jgi:hypothetical protein
MVWSSKKVGITVAVCGVGTPLALAWALLLSLADYEGVEATVREHIRQQHYGELRSMLAKATYKSRVRMVRPLAADGSDPSCALLRTMAYDDSLAVRVTLANECGRMPIGRSAPILSVLLRDVSHAVVTAAVASVEAVTGREFGYDPRKPLPDNQVSLRQCSDYLKGMVPNAGEDRGEDKIGDSQKAPMKTGAE